MQKADQETYEKFGVKWDWAGGQQALPKPIREIRLDEFLRLTFCGAYGIQDRHFGSTLIPTRNIQDDPYTLASSEVSNVGTHYYRFPQYGIAVASRYTAKDRRIWPDAHWVGYTNDDDYSGHEVRFFKFGCEHKFKELSMKECKDKGVHHFGNCWHVKECTICGYTQSYDSSG